MSQDDLHKSLVGFLRERERTVELGGKPKTPEEANYEERIYGGERCIYCRWATNRTPEDNNAQWRWCRALYSPNRVDNILNPKNQQVGMWTFITCGCTEFRRR